MHTAFRTVLTVVFALSSAPRLTDWGQKWFEHVKAIFK